MLIRKIAAAALLLGTVFASSAFATTVKSLDPFWVKKAGEATWALPADLGFPCGNESQEPICEPAGVFLISQPIAPAITPGYVTINDSTGATSDILAWANAGPLGQGLLTFYSDPNLTVNLTGFTLAFNGLCTEDATAGCATRLDITLADGSSLAMIIASDGENFFDPFLVG